MKTVDCAIHSTLRRSMRQSIRIVQQHWCRLWENDIKNTLARWPICLTHPSKPLRMTNSRLGKLEWKESKKKTSIVCSHYSNRLSSWGRISRRCELKWLRGITHNVVISLLSRPTKNGITARRHTDLSYHPYEEDFSSSFSTWPKPAYPLTDQSRPDEAVSSTREKQR